MYVRLAFAIAAHLDPDILIVDEVLAVGDTQFQKKCLGKMGQVASNGRTVLFVSHNMQAISNLCGYGICLEKGIAYPKTDVYSAISEYAKKSISDNLHFPIDRGDVSLYFFEVQQDGHVLSEYDGGKPINVRMGFELKKDLSYFQAGIIVRSHLGDVVCISLLADWNKEYADMKFGGYEIQGFIPPNFLLSGAYTVEPAISRHNIVDYGFGEVASLGIQVRLPENYNTAYLGRRPWGVVMLNANWKCERLDTADVRGFNR